MNGQLNLNIKEEYALKLLGFNKYEGRAYLTSLLLGRARAVEIARRSGIPQPRIYDTLYSLVAKGFLQQEDEKGVKQFHSVPIDSVYRAKAKMVFRAYRYLKSMQENFTGWHWKPV